MLICHNVDLLRCWSSVRIGSDAFATQLFACFGSWALPSAIWASFFVFTVGLNKFLLPFPRYRTTWPEAAKRFRASTIYWYWLDHILLSFPFVHFKGEKKDWSLTFIGRCAFLFGKRNLTGTSNMTTPTYSTFVDLLNFHRELPQSRWTQNLQGNALNDVFESAEIRRPQGTG